MYVKVTNKAETTHRRLARRAALEAKKRVTANKLLAEAMQKARKHKESGKEEKTKCDCKYVWMITNRKSKSYRNLFAPKIELTFW
jgi:hypothetical protein